MKKYLFFIATILLTTVSCNYDDEFEKINGRLDAIENTQIATLEEQINAISTTLPQLESADNELKGYIANLESTSENLQQQAEIVNAKIEEVKTSLQGEMSTSESNIIAELKSLESELQGEILFINNTITTLQDSKNSLEQQITELSNRIDSEVADNSLEEWVAATFVTLEQYNKLYSEIATVKMSLEAVSKSVTDLETRINNKISNDIATAVSAVNVTIQQKVSEVTNAYTAIVNSTKSEITAAYTGAIKTAINDADASMKLWVNESLSAYSTIADVEAKITILQNACGKSDDALQAEIDSLRKILSETDNAVEISKLETKIAELESYISEENDKLKNSLQAEIDSIYDIIADGKKEVENAYTNAINDAIISNNGVISKNIADAISSVNQSVDAKLESINARISTLEQRVGLVENRIATVEEQIININSSISYIQNVSKELENTINILEQSNSATSEEIAALKGKNEELKTSIDELQIYLDEEIRRYRTWATVTFATMEQYVNIATQLEAINYSIEQNSIQCQELSEAIEQAEERMRGWVNEELAAYYTISEVEAKIEELYNSIEEEDGKLAIDIKTLQQSLEELRSDMIYNYNSVIEECINTTNGIIDEKIRICLSDVEETINVKMEPINQLIASVEERLNTVEIKIATVEEQIENINNTIEMLRALNSELEESIKVFENNYEVPTAEIETLKRKDLELISLIGELQLYVDCEIGNLESWSSATFATIQQYDGLISIILDIENSLSAFERKDKNLEQQIENVLYQVANLDEWCDRAIHNRYTIAEVDAKLTELKGYINEGDAMLNEWLDQLDGKVYMLEQQMYSVYASVIDEATVYNNGVVNDRMQAEIYALSEQINTEVASLNVEIVSLWEKINKIEQDAAQMKEDIANLMKRIQSVSYIPKYSDGKATMLKSKVAEFDFQVSPKDAVADIAANWQSLLSMKAVYTLTRTVSLIDLPIVEFEADETTGIITVRVSGENLCEEFYNGEQSVSASLYISDGNNSISTNFVEIVSAD